MAQELRITTNNVPRDVIYDYELTSAERDDFDYLDWPAIERGEDSASFLRYKGQLYDLGELMTTRNLPEFSPLRAWDGYLNDSFFSGVVVRYVEDFERIIVGTFIA